MRLAGLHSSPQHPNSMLPIFLSQAFHKLSVDTHIVGVHSTNDRQVGYFSTRMTASSTIFFKRSFLREIATVQVPTIKYESKIFSQGFQKCPRISNPSTGSRVMALQTFYYIVYYIERLLYMKNTTQSVGSFFYYTIVLIVH